MKRTLTYTLLIVGMLSALLLGSSCRRLEMYDDYGGNVYIHIEIDVDVDVDADVDLDAEVSHESRVMPPQIFAVAFYHPDTHVLLQTEYVPAEGGQVHIAPGHYDVVVYNFDTDYVRVRGTYSSHTLEAYTANVTSDISNRFSALSEYIARNNALGQARGYDGQPLLFEPDHLFAGTVDNVNIPVSVAEDEVIHLHVKARTLSERYTIKIYPVINGEYMHEAETFLTGMASAKLIASREVSSGPATIWFPIYLDRENNCLSTVFYSLGRYPDAEDNYVLLHLVDVNGVAYNREWDVTDQLAGGGHHIVIHDEVELKPTPSGGNTPSVDMWDDIESNIELK